MKTNKFISLAIVLSILGFVRQEAFASGGNPSASEEGETEITPPRMLGTRELATIRFRHAQTSGHLETRVRLEALVVNPAE